MQKCQYYNYYTNVIHNCLHVNDYFCDKEKDKYGISLRECAYKGCPEYCELYPEVKEQAIKDSIEYKINSAINLLKDNGYKVFKEM